MGKVGKGVTCTVKGCGNPAVRSISVEKAASSGLPLEKGRRAYLCERHYKEFKRKTRRDRRMEKLRFMA